MADQMPPCPKCGEKVEIEEHHDEVDVGVGVIVGPSAYRCNKCEEVWE